MRYTPFHVHSYFSLLEGVDSPEVLVQRAAACGNEALALTDSNNLYGAVPFIEAARKHGIRPILGACLRQGRQHCVALIAEPIGYESLCRVLSRLNLGQGDKETRRQGDSDCKLQNDHLQPLLVENADGLQVLTNDAHLLTGLREAFGPRLWLEVVRPLTSHLRSASLSPCPLVPLSSPSTERRLLELADRLGIKPVASTAAHFATPEGYETYRLITAVRQGTLLDRLPPQLPITPAHHLVDGETLHRRFRDLPEAIVNAELLAEQCRSDVLPRGVVLPPVWVPKAHTAESYLRLLCRRGLRRMGQGDKEARGQGVARERLEQELHIIHQRDLASYFLVVRDIARYARRRGYSMALRGSAGNSLVCYLLRITNVNPLQFDLPLERFLHAGRPDLPDIDLDFDWRIRDEVIAWVFERYGPTHTAMISSHLFLQPASAFREAGKVHGLSNEQISRILEVWQRGGLSQWEGLSTEGWEKDNQTRGQGDKGAKDPGQLVSESPHHPITPSRHQPPQPPPGFPLEPERWPRLLADARRLLHRPHHLSIHPGGVVITPRPIENYVPLQRAAKGIVITQFEKDAIEHIGLVKIDLLGNRALSTVNEARRIVRRRQGDKQTRGQGDSDCKLQIGNVSLSPGPPVSLSPGPLVSLSSTTLSLLQRGDTLGINQLESPAMRHLLVQMRPRNLMDVIQALALIRPGAASIGAKEQFIRRRRGLKPVAYDHPRLAPLLKDTEGLMLYEDDALGVVQVLTGFSAPEADRFRKQVTKCTDPNEAAELSKAFLIACERNGVSREVAERVWVQLAKFNSYSFCKSHSVSYGLIAWEAAFYKANYPLGFWVAALNNNQGMYPRRVYIEALKRAGISVLLPCVNRSEREFALEENRQGDRQTRRQGDSDIKLEIDNNRLPSVSLSPCPLVPLSPCHPVPLSSAGIRTGLAVIHSLDEAAREAILEDRTRRGPFGSLTDFRRRVSIGPEALALLIQVGAFDFTGQARPAMLLEAELDDYCKARKAKGKEPSPGEALFADSSIPDDSWLPADYSQTRRWKQEWDRLGFLVGPPVMQLYRPLLPKGLVDSRSLHEFIGRRIRAAGLVATARFAPTKTGQHVQFVTLEDEWGFIDVVLFAGTFSQVTYLGMGPYIVHGIVEEQHDVITVTATRWEKPLRDGEEW